MNLSFTPCRQLPIIPLDAVLGRPYTLPEDPQLCKTCISAIIKLSSCEEYEDGIISQEMGIIRNLRARDTCQLCQLVLRAVLDLHPPYAADYTDDENQIRLAMLKGIPYLTILSGRYAIAFIHDAAETLSSNTDTPDEINQTDIRSSCSLPAQACGRDFPISIDFIRRCLQSCESDHRCGNEGPTVHARNTLMLPSIVLDVKGKRLVSQDHTSQRYCALSYVYREQGHFRTTRDIFNNLQLVGALDDPKIQLPATIRDAIALVEAIGERYIWIHSLCIIHDDQDQLQRELSIMGEIYRNATLTIAVVSASGANATIPGVLPRSRNFLPLAQLWGRDILGHPLALQSSLRGSKYESRAWTYQERLLSTRTIYITKNLAYFQCMQGCWSESKIREISGSDINPLHNLRTTSSFTQKLIRASLKEERPTWQSEWSIYFHLVQAYSQRKLTYASDRLAAFGGIQDALGTSYATRFLAGLPLSGLPEALHWIPGYTDCTSNIEHQRDRREGFPSWSWAGQDSPIEWLDAVILSEWCELKVEVSARPLGANCTSEHQDSPSIQCCSLLARVSDFSATLGTGLVFPEIISMMGESTPIPLIKMFDSHGQWCGRLFHRSPSIISNPDLDKLGLLLLSTSKPCKVAIEIQPGSSITEWDYCFDTTLFPIESEHGAPARLCNLLLIEFGEDGRAERRALCQIHSDAWEVIDKREQELILF